MQAFATVCMSCWWSGVKNTENTVNSQDKVKLVILPSSKKTKQCQDCYYIQSRDVKYSPAYSWNSLSRGMSEVSSNGQLAFSSFFGNERAMPHCWCLQGSDTVLSLHFLAILLLVNSHLQQDGKRHTNIRDNAHICQNTTNHQVSSEALLIT